MPVSSIRKNDNLFREFQMIPDDEKYAEYANI